MDELHRQAIDVTKHFLASCHEPAVEDSRLFHDLEQFALDALRTVKSRGSSTRKTAARITRKVSRMPGEVRGYWPQPVH
jgi:hypothetical protein